MIDKALFLLILSTTAHAAILHNLDDLKVIEAPISRQGLTRIAIKGDRIANVFGVAGEYALEADEDQGQIFISTLESRAGLPIHLTLTTEGGYTQDLRLFPQEKAPEAIILKQEEAIKKEVLKEKQNHSPIMREEVEALIEAAVNGHIPLGYKSQPLGLHTLQGPYSLINELKGEKLCCLTYEVKNHTKVPLILSEEEFSRNKDLRKDSRGQDPIAIFMPKKALTPGEGAYVYVVLRAIH